MPLTPFPIAFPNDDLAAARTFYAGVLGCSEGRSAGAMDRFRPLRPPVRRAPFAQRPRQAPCELGRRPRVPHFGVVLHKDSFHRLAARVRAAGVLFEIEPYTRFQGLPGEQATMFFYDPPGNALEFKAFADIGQLFAK